MTREQEYYAAYAKAAALADCAAAAYIEVLGAGIPAHIKDEQAYRDEVKLIGAELTQRGIDLDAYADSLRPA